MRVEIIRMMPVIHARTRLTRNTSAILPAAAAAASAEPSFSSNQRGDGRVVNFTSNKVFDSLAGDSLKTTTPTI